MMVDAVSQGRPRRQRRTVARVVLTIEPESLDGEAIDTAVRLARAYRAELVTLFVKTSDMLNMAAMPFGATVISRSGVSRSIDPIMLDHRLERLARQAEALLARSAAGLRWSFRTATGHTEQVAAREASQGDLLAICSRTARQVNDTVGALACSLLLLGDGVAGGRPVVALFEGDTGVLAGAREMAEAFDRDLAIVLPATAGSKERRAAQGWLSRHGVGARLVKSPSADPAALARELAQLSPGLLVMDRHGPAARAVQQVHEADRRALPLLLVS